MSVRKLAVKLSMTLAVILGGQSATWAGEPQLPPADPFAFDPDFQWFEPIYQDDILDMKPKKRAHTGWFGTYDRLTMWGKRPKQGIDTGDEYKLDEGGGHRYDVGYMTPGQDTGWRFGYMDLDVSAGDTIRIDRINRLNSENLDEDGPEFALGANRFGLPILSEDGNVIGFSRRFYNIGVSLNNVDLDSFELNKTWRLEPYHYGGILEPMVGIRYVSADDHGFLRTYSRTREELDTGVANPAATLYTLSAFYRDLGVSDDAIEILDEQITSIENDIYAAQLGFRYFKFQNRFRYSAEFRCFTGVTLQCAKRNRRQTTTVYDGFDVGADVTSNIQLTNATEFMRNDEFFIGFDARADIGYQLTKLIHVRGGFQIIDLARGLWRAQRTVNNGNAIDNDATFGLGPSDQMYLAVGYSFGIEMNH